MSKTRKAFVIMPFSPPIDSYYEAIFKPALEAAGYTATRVDNLFDPRPIMLDIRDSIAEADLILCEMSGKNPNVFYELGLAHAIGKPAILVSNDESDIPFDLRHVRVIIYDRAQAAWDNKLQNAIKAAAQGVSTSHKIWPPPITEVMPKKLLGYGIKIVSPKHGEIRYGPFEVTGSYDFKPPEGSVWIFIASLDDNEFWPQGTVQFDEAAKTWKGMAFFYERPARDANIIVAQVGETGKILCDYYTRVGHETGNFMPLLKLTSDVVEFDRVKVSKFPP